MRCLVVTFYHFFDFADFAAQQAPVRDLLIKHNIKGSLLIAAEGINGTLSGDKEDIAAVLAYLKERITKSEFAHKESWHERQPFGKAKVRLKKETISLGEPVALEHVGQYVEPHEWNALILDPDTVVIDARNAYETHLGTFEGATDPKTRTFKELPGFIRKTLGDNKDAKIAAFCTGGIRCEKLTAWMKQEGFKNVYHLKGGILKYLEEIPENESKWQGECYVFDERVAVGHGLAPSSTASMCRACGHALTPEDRQRDDYVEGVRCRFCD